MPSDSIDYHKAKDVGLPEKIRIPTRHLERWTRLSNHLQSTNAAVFDWLFEKCREAIDQLPLPQPPLPAPGSSDAPLQQAHTEQDREAIEEDRLSDLDDDPDIFYAMHNEGMDAALAVTEDGADEA